MVAMARWESASGSAKVLRISVFATAIVIGLVVRLLLLQTPFHGYDSFAYGHWTWRLVHEPLSHFYIDDGQAFPDHLPGDVWLLKLVGETAHMFNHGVDFYTPAYIRVLVLLVTLFDAMAAIAIWRVGRLFGSSARASGYALAYWLAPAPIFVASVWGQTDGVSAALAVIALGFGIANRFPLAVLMLTMCVMVKPPFGLLFMPLLLGWWHHDSPIGRDWFKRIARTGLACLGFVAIISAPFHISLIGEWGQWSLVERLRLANDLYPMSTLGAHNFWIVFDPFNWPPDDRVPWVLGLSRQTVGWTMFVVVILLTLCMLIRRWRGAITMVHASNILMLGFFLTMTRMHERYVFPMAVLAILLAVMDGRFRWYAVAMNVLVFANISLRFIWFSDGEHGLLRVLDSTVVASSTTVYLLVVMTYVVYGWLVYDAISKKPTGLSHLVDTECVRMSQHE